MYYLNFNIVAKFHQWQTQVNPYKLSTFIVTRMTVDKSRCTAPLKESRKMRKNIDKFEWMINQRCQCPLQFLGERFSSINQRKSLFLRS
jgi:hypothetical protein